MNSKVTYILISIKIKYILSCFSNNWYHRYAMSVDMTAVLTWQVLGWMVTDDLAATMAVLTYHADSVRWLGVLLLLADMTLLD